jgi:hypothetical protein
VTPEGTAKLLDFGLAKAGQGPQAEACATISLTQDLVDRLGRRLVDLLVGDALYLQAPFVQAVEGLGMDWVFNLKANQPELLEESKRWTAGPPAGIQVGVDRELRWWHLPEVDWPVADRLVRVVKTERVEQKRQGTVSQEGAHRKKGKIPVTQESASLSNRSRPPGPPGRIWRAGKRRVSIKVSA